MYFKEGSLAGFGCMKPYFNAKSITCRSEVTSQIAHWLHRKRSLTNKVKVTGVALVLPQLQHTGATAQHLLQYDISKGRSAYTQLFTGTLHCGLGCDIMSQCIEIAQYTLLQIFNVQ